MKVGTGTASNDTSVNAEGASNVTVVSKKRSGRIPRSEYKNVKEMVISHKDLKPGDPCPTLCGGKLYQLKPSAIFKIDGASFACPINYSIERLRCALCCEIQKPEHELTKENILSVLSVILFYINIIWHYLCIV